MKLRSHTISDWASALHVAAYYDRLGVVELLVEHGVAVDLHVLHWAAEGDSKDVVEFLIQQDLGIWNHLGVVVNWLLGAYRSSWESC